MRVRTLVAVAVWVFCCGSVAAHTRSMSHSLWDMDENGAEVRLRVSRLELTRLARDPVSSHDDDAAVADLVVKALRLYSNDGPCVAVDSPRRRRAAQGYVAYSWRYECSGEPRSIETGFLLDVAPSHLHFARVRKPGKAAVEKVLTDADPVWLLDSDGGAGGRAPMSIGEYVLLGIEHILTGWDHLAFVFALVLLAFTLRDIATLVTSFTLAHSITLALAVLGFVEPKSHVVEALIGFSIALVGIENAFLSSRHSRSAARRQSEGWRSPFVVPLTAFAVISSLCLFGTALPVQAILGLALFTACHLALLTRSNEPARLRAAVAFAFGLIHGFGFAGIMMELELENTRLVPALFGFNAGVELGQLAIVALIWPLLVLARRWQGLSAWVGDVGSAAVTGIGLYWFVTRAFS